MDSRLDISVVLPVYNERENLTPLCDELLAVLDSLQGRRWEVLFVDDASRDDSRLVLKKLAQLHPGVRFIGFKRNCGQSAAFSAGFQAARGDTIITMDADMQNDPADIPAMLTEYEAGADMVIGWRKNRRDSWKKRAASRLGNTVRNWLTGESVRDTGCSLKVMRADMVRRIPMFNGMHRFLPTLMRMQGARIREMPVNHRPRLHGVSKYGNLGRARKGFFDLFAVRWMQRRMTQFEIEEER